MCPVYHDFLMKIKIVLQPMSTKEYVTWWVILNWNSCLSQADCKEKGKRSETVVWQTLLKLMRTPLDVYFTAFKSIVFSLSMHLLPRMNVMLDFIWTLPVHLRGTRNKWTLQKILVHGRIRTTNTATLGFQHVPLTIRLLGPLTICD